MTVKDFEPVKIIGKGAFGEVRLCKDTANIFVAVKKLRITDMVRKNQVKHIMAEREMLLKANNEWIVSLHACFKDKRFLYLGK